MIKFGSTIKRYRTKRGLTQVTLARRLGIESTYLSAIENGRREPSLKLVKQISKAISIPAEVLFWDAIELSATNSGRDRKAFEVAKKIVHHHFKII